MRNNVYSDTFWYGDMFLPVWAKNEKFSKFHIQYIWKIVRGWHHQLAHLNIHKDWSRNVFPKKLEISKCHIFLISHPIFIIFSLFYRKKCTLSFKIDSILEWISPLNETKWERDMGPNSRRFIIFKSTDYLKSVDYNKREISVIQRVQ